MLCSHSQQISMAHFSGLAALHIFKVADEIVALKFNINW
jgi:hypothetical protein